jgi:hypothetical protein
MNEELSWHIGKDAVGQESLDRPPYKAYFYWKREGRIVRSAEFTREALETEITRLKNAGEDTTQFELALRELG